MLRKKDRDVTIKGMKEELDRDFEKKELRKGVEEVFERLLKIKRGKRNNNNNIINK